MKKERQENIQFDQMSDLDWNSGNGTRTTIAEKEYDSLYDELLDKCNPGKFKLAETSKFDLSNEIYAKLKQMGNGIGYESELKRIRNRAIDELGVNISTTKEFNRLQTIFDPENYLNMQPYDKDLVENSGRLFAQIFQNKDDIRALELIENQSIAADVIEAFDFLNLKYEDYIKKYKEAKKYSIDISETDYFRTKSAASYLNKFPIGKYSDEAHCFINEAPGEYLKKYPKGRYFEEATKEDEDNYKVGLLAITIIVVIVLAIINIIM